MLSSTLLHRAVKNRDLEIATCATDYYFDQLVGMGWDDDASHSILSADGSRAFLEFSANAGACWTIVIPRGPVPA
jgi:hypothetical protein